MMALTQGGRLDYFGQNVELALALVAATAPGGDRGDRAPCVATPSVAERLAALPDQLGMRVLADGEWALRLRAPRAEARALPAAGDSIRTVIRPTV